MAEKKVEKKELNSAKILKNPDALQSKEWCERYARLDAELAKVPAKEKAEFIKQRTQELFSIHGK